MKKLKFSIGALAIAAILGLNLNHALNGYGVESNEVLAKSMSSISTGSSSGNKHSCPSGRVLHEKNIEVNNDCLVVEYSWASVDASVSDINKWLISINVKADWKVRHEYPGTRINCVKTGDKDDFCCQMNCTKNGSTVGTR